jgi:hypothetical protein
MVFCFCFVEGFLWTQTACHFMAGSRLAGFPFIRLALLLRVGLADVPALVAQLTTLTTELAARGLDTSRENSTLFTASYYQVAAASDANNPDLPAVFAAWLACGAANSSCRAIAAEQARLLPALELSELETALVSAIADASRVLAQPTSRLPSPLFNATEMVLISGYWREPTGVPRFATGFNQMNPESISSGSQRAYTIGYTDFSIGISWCLLSNGSIPVSVITGLSAALAAARAGGYKVEIFVDHSRAPEWALQQWPDIANCTNKYVGYDIDHPRVIDMLAQMLGGVAQAITDMPGQLVNVVASFCLHNEPYFPNATSPWSALSYAAWLNASYAGNITALNSGWGTSYTAFSDIGWWDLQVKQARVWREGAEYN